LTITLKVVNEFLSSFAHSDKCLTVWFKNYPLHTGLLYVCTLPCKFMIVKIVP